MYTMADSSVRSPVKKAWAQSGESLPPGAKSNAPTKEKRKRKASTPRVKRPMNSFMVWATPERRKIIADYPKSHNSEISKKLGAKWQLLTDAQKKPFINEAKRLRAQHMADYPNYKFTSKRKPKKKGQNCLPGEVPAAGVNPTLGSVRVGRRTDPYAPTNGWSTQPYAFMQEQFGYTQQPSVNQPPFQPMQRYEPNGLRYGPMLASSETCMNPAPRYNMPAPYTQQTTGTLSFGSSAPGTEYNSSSSSPVTPSNPHPQMYMADMSDSMNMYIPLSGDLDDTPSLQNQLQNVHQHY